METSVIQETTYRLLKPFDELSAKEIDELSVETLTEYQKRSEIEYKRQQKEYRNRKSKLKREAELAGKNPWEKKRRRDRFLFRMGVGSLYYLASLKEQEAEPLLKKFLAHLNKTDRDFTANFYTLWKEAGFPTINLEENVEPESSVEPAQTATSVSE